MTDQTHNQDVLQAALELRNTIVSMQRTFKKGLSRSCHMRTYLRLMNHAQEEAQELVEVCSRYGIDQPALFGDE